MQPMPQANAMNLIHSKNVLLGTSALVCLALSAPVMARDIVITSGTTTNNSGGSLNGYDTANVTGTLDTGTTDSEHGILASGDNNKITVSKEGHIITGGNNAYGIYHTGDNNETTVLGSITTEGNIGFGIFNYGNTNKTTVSGSIKLVGNHTATPPIMHGVYNLGNNNETTVSGSIKTEGKYVGGIANWGNNNTTTVSGSITSTGERGNGIWYYGNNNTTTISGTVKATGTKSAALYNEVGDGNSFTLDEGATIIGDILARDDATNNAYDATNSKLIFNLGASTSYAYSVSGKGEGTTAGQWDFDDLDERTQAITTTGTGCDTNIDSAGNDTCNLVTAVGNGNAKAQDELQFGMNTSMIGSLKRHDKPAAAAATFALSTDTTPDTLDEGKYSTPQKSMPSTQVLKRNVWANVLGRHKRTVFNHNSIIL